MSDAYAFGEKIRALREKAGLGLRTTAKLVDVSPTYLSLVENGNVDPPVEDVVVRLARVVGDDLDVLLCSAQRLPVDVERYVLSCPALLKALRAAARTKMDTAILASHIDAATPWEPE